MATIQHQIRKSLETLIEMLTDRGLDMSGINPEHFLTQNNNKLTFSFTINEFKIVYYLSNKFKWSEVKTLFNLEEEKSTNIILIVGSKLSATNLKSINSTFDKIQIFEIKELLFNVSRHELVPKHEIVSSEDEINDLIAKFNIKTKYQFPHILKTDPMSKYLNLKQGDVVRISRISPTSGVYISYRVCM